ncbi:MAG: hypothetical protein ACOX1J_02875 [Dethiobacteria bacterium]
MPQNVLYIAFVWNQHQPYYLDTGRGEFIMPWVRLHADQGLLPDGGNPEKLSAD